MMNAPIRKVARLDKAELTHMLPAWTDAERGRSLRLQFRQKGIDPDRLYHLEYHPQRHCWLILQESAADVPLPPLQGSAGKADEVFYTQVRASLQLSARSAYATLAAGSSHFARHGRPFQATEPARELTPADLLDLLGGVEAGDSSIHFDSEGSWRSKPNDN